MIRVSGANVSSDAVRPVAYTIAPAAANSSATRSNSCYAVGLRSYAKR